MTTGPSTPRGRVQRVDDRLGLAVARAGLSQRTLVTYARDHVAVRTPSRPELFEGNTLDLVSEPAADQVDGWLERFSETIGVLGVPHVLLRWERPAPADAPTEAWSAEPELLAAFQHRDLALLVDTVSLLGELCRPASPPGVRFVAVPAPSVVEGGDDPTERLWHGAGVLYRYAAGDAPDDWRDHDAEHTRWTMDVQRELAQAGRARVWLAVRHGAPVGRATLVHDRQGLAVIEDVIVHPAHRGRGIGRGLVHAAAAAYLTQGTDLRVGVRTTPGSAAERVVHGLGFRPHATVWSALRARSDTLRRPVE